ncbi:hypothetical protein ACI65C_003869 [Semiaphis heraclei]
MGNKKSRLLRLKKNRGNVSSIVNWQKYRLKNTENIDSLTITDEGQNNDVFQQSSIQLTKIDDAEMGCSILSPSTSHNVLDLNYKLLVENTNENKQEETFPKRSQIVDGPDEHYGAVNELECAIIDMPHDEYLGQEQIFLNNLKLTPDEIEEVERRTVGQQNNDEWQKYRKSRLTASNFGKVCKLRANTSRANTVKNILYDIFQGNSATRYGIENEPLAKRDFEKIYNIKIESAGLFIHTALNYLAASPDGLIGKDAIIEIKCPQSFVVDKIFKDEEFWKNNIEPRCTKFFMESMVPEIIDSRFDRGLLIRSGLPEQ